MMIRIELCSEEGFSVIKNIKRFKKNVSLVLYLVLALGLLSSCDLINKKIETFISAETNISITETEVNTSSNSIADNVSNESSEGFTTPEAIATVAEIEPSEDSKSLIRKDRIVSYTVEEIRYDVFAPYATYSVIWDGVAKLYKLDKNDPKYNGKTVTVNAGHGTKNGTKFKTFSHPDFTPKVSGGTTAEGSIVSTAVSDGTTLNSGMSEATANLKVAMALKDRLLSNGYSVLMIREDNDCRFDNVARTVIANENSDAHVAIHFDSTNTGKGIYFITPYNNEGYLNMEPLKSNAGSIRKLGKCIIEAFRELGEKIWKDSGTLQGDLTQISYSTIPSVDIELGDKKTEISDEKIDNFAEGIKDGLNRYFGFE